jgi:hypothetical protein
MGELFLEHLEDRMVVCQCGQEHMELTLDTEGRLYVQCPKCFKVALLAPLRADDFEELTGEFKLITGGL